MVERIAAGARARATAPRARIASGVAWALLLGSAAACTARGGSDWVRDPSQQAESRPPAARELDAKAPSAPAAVEDGPSVWSSIPAPERRAEERSPVEYDDLVTIREHGTGRASPAPAAPPTEWRDTGLYRNTYYDFPTEAPGPKEATIYDATCKPIAQVTQAFHDSVCVQGSGRLGSGATVSFAKRGCECAAVCPRTGQKVCFEALDPARFPSGRGATGRPITPLRSVAVDSTVIPLGTVLFVPEFVGLPRGDGTPHDGCFIAEDRGLKVVGRQIDVFTGDPSVTARWNALVPSNRGVQVRVDDPTCRRRLAGG